ncbi:hypothetical protein FNO01nite_26290 [Flavobacterium noncentrifugens]|uniref:HNH endonuclease n=1 Tax=Flavobacterium noncentrifugens TaxID=1128970 RepID=A0A1G8ZFU0_9FLAO|nr:HNH endonuclease signature motif containing protein [Flavobacterium noncentrifugens]GEP51957.1 hypothetical protein FNO01nite_26290 [Flavobacterium noncentrifugens]SDK13823.1 HNH endonuclease [Flavobacterium noncentrifugens]
MEKLLQYGINTELASLAINVGLNLTSIRGTSKKNLIAVYGLDKYQATILKECVTRNPINEADVQRLLERNSATCCVCKGIKSDAYIIHHIEHYNISQNNDYDNLALLCPNDHELAHREGEALANKLTPKQIKQFKRNWENYVENVKIRQATLTGNIHDLDFVNVPRILELAIQIKKVIPSTRFTQQLLQSGKILDDGTINPQLYIDHNLNPNTPLKFFALFGSTTLIQHYYEMLLDIFSAVNVNNLEDLLKVSEVRKGILGKFCYYVGGVYGKQYRGVVSEESDYTSIHIRKKPFIVEWAVNPMYITSATAGWRIARRPIYAVYGKILNIEQVIENEKEYIRIEIRPYAFGLAIEKKDKTPLIHYLKYDWDKYQADEDL